MPRAVDRELDAGSRAHYEDAAYYTATYKRRIDDVQYYVGLAQKYGGPILEYGVGNGRIALPLARHGHAVTGLDHSGPMLADLKVRLRDEPSDVRRRVRLRRGDMRSARLRKRFPLVFCAFNTALHLYTRQDVERFFAGVRAHLSPRGHFVVDVAVPSLGDLLREPSRAYHTPRFRHPSTEQVVRYGERYEYDGVRQICFVSMEFDPVGKRNAGWSAPLAHRQFFPQEFEALLHYNGLRVTRVDGDFCGGPLTRQSDVMIWHARKRP